MGKSKPATFRQILPKDPRWPLTAPKPIDLKVAGQDKFILRLPPGMRDRIKKSAALNKRSMNTEIIYALEALYPPEPDVFDVLSSVHRAIDVAQHADAMPYRDQLVKALDEFSERLSSGLEFDQFRPPYAGPPLDPTGALVARMDRWNRAREIGVEQADLEREIARGLLRKMRGDTVRQAIEYFDAGQPDRALGMYRLHEVHFADKDAAHKAIETDLRAFYEENWGDIDETPPWEEDGEFE